MSSPETHPMPPPPRQGSGGKCLIGCGVIFLILLVACGGGVWWIAVNWQKWMGGLEHTLIGAAAGALREPLVESVNDAPIREEDKRAIIEQVDRVVAEAKAGNIDAAEMEEIMTNLAESPLLQAGTAYFVEEQYVKPSGLPQDEKDQARRTLQRVARGAFEKKISGQQLDAASDPIAERKANGEKEFKQQITDEELRQFLTELQSLADGAMIPDEPFEVDIAAEIKKAVDEALGEK